MIPSWSQILMGSASAYYPPAPVPEPEPTLTGLDFSLDTTRIPAGYVYSNENHTAVNDTAGSNQLNKWAISVGAFPQDNTIRYWEVHVGAGAAQYDGYMGVSSEANRDGGTITYTASPTTSGGVGYRGDGSIWASDTRRVLGLATWGAGAILMFALDAMTGDFWVGKNGVWSRNPDTQAANFTLGGGKYYPFVQGRNPADGGTIVFQATNFTYPVPSTTIPLGDPEKVPPPMLYASHTDAAVFLKQTGSLASHTDAAVFVKQAGVLATHTNAAVFLRKL